MVENDHKKVLWDLQVQPDKQVMTNQPVEEEDRKTVAIDVAVPNDTNIRKEEEKKLSERLAGEDEDNTGSRGFPSEYLGAVAPQAGGTGPADPGTNI